MSVDSLFVIVFGQNNLIGQQIRENSEFVIIHTACIWFWMAKEVGVASDGNFSSYLIGRSWYNHFRSFSMGGNGNNTIYSLLST